MACGPGYSSSARRSAHATQRRELRSTMSQTPVTRRLRARETRGGSPLTVPIDGRCFLRLAGRGQADPVCECGYSVDGGDGSCRSSGVAPRDRALRQRRRPLDRRSEPATGWISGRWTADRLIRRRGRGRAAGTTDFPPQRRLPDCGDQSRCRGLYRPIVYRNHVARATQTRWVRPAARRFTTGRYPPRIDRGRRCRGRPESEVPAASAGARTTGHPGRSPNRPSRYRDRGCRIPSSRHPPRPGRRSWSKWSHYPSAPWSSRW